MPKARKGPAQKTSPDISMPVAARAPSAAMGAVVMEVEAQAWAGMSVQGSVTTVGPAPGGATTLIRFVNVPVARRGPCRPA